MEIKIIVLSGFELNGATIIVSQNIHNGVSTCSSSVLKVVYQLIEEFLNPCQVYAVGPVLQ